MIHHIVDNTLKNCLLQKYTFIDLYQYLQFYHIMIIITILAEIYAIFEYNPTLFAYFCKTIYIWRHNYDR